MKSPATYSVDVDKDLDDAALWAVIDSAAAASIVTSSATKPLKPLYLKYASPISIPNTSPQLKAQKNPRNLCNYSDDGVFQDHLVERNYRPQKVARVKTPCVSEIIETSSPPLAMVKHVQRTPVTPLSHSSPGTTCFAFSSNSPNVSDYSPAKYESEKENVIRHSLSGQFPSVSLFKEYQDAAMAILEKSDYTLISGYPYIKKTGWRKIAFYFNLSFEIKDKTIEFDDNRNVQRAEFVVRAHMQGGRFSDGWGSCERREKKFLKPNHDIPSTAETRAKNKACQDLLGIGEYRPGANRAHR